MMVALAALEAGLITPDDQRLLPRPSAIWARTASIAGRSAATAAIDMVAGARAVLRRLFLRGGAGASASTRIAAMAQALGLGQRARHRDARRAAGPDADARLEAGDARASPGTRAKRWSPASARAIVLTTPLQLAVMTRAPGRNGGMRRRPRGSPRRAAAVTPRRRRRRRSACRQRLSTSSLRRHARGGPRRSAAPPGRPHRRTKGIAMAGKTGTAQVRAHHRAPSARPACTSARTRPWNERDHALFVCFAPVDAPRYACSVIVEHGGGGSSAAAPIARDIMLRRLRAGAVPAAPACVAPPARRRRAGADHRRREPAAASRWPAEAAPAQLAALSSCSR